MGYISYKGFVGIRSKLGKDELIKMFLQVKSIDELAQFLLEAKGILSYYLYINSDCYTEFNIPKKTGGVRTISAPERGLKRILKKLNYVLNHVYDTRPKKSAHGFVHQKSIITNAKKHTNKKFVLNIDLKDFFPSIHFGRVKGLFKSAPFNFNEEISHILANFVTYEGVLPQGAPTSPILTNFIFRRLDSGMELLAKNNNSIYKIC